MKNIKNSPDPLPPADGDFASRLPAFKPYLLKNSPEKILT